MKKLFAVRKGHEKFFACKYDCDFYTIDKITKSVGYTVVVKDSLEDLEDWMKENGYKKVA